MGLLKKREAAQRPGLSTETDGPALNPQKLLRLAAGFLAVVICLIAGLEAWIIKKDYENAFAVASDSAINLTRASAQQADDAMRQVDSMLVGIRERMEGDGLPYLDPKRLHNLFVQQMQSLPQLDGVLVCDEFGQWKVSDKWPVSVKFDSASRDYFTYHKTHTDRGLRIGRVVISRTTGEQIIPVSRRLDYPDGSFAGVFLGAVKASYFSAYYAAFKIDDNGIFVLALRDGTVLVKRPAVDGVVGKSLAAGEVFKDRLPHGPEGMVEMTSVVDKLPRLFGYKASQDFPLVVEVGISTESIIHRWQHSLIKSFIVLVSLLLGIGLFGAFFLRQLRSKIDMAAQLQIAHAAVQEMAMKDSLTGLGNRRELDRMLAAEVTIAKRTGLPLALIMLDIDFFKHYNDRYGHVEGDECLRIVASSIQLSLKRPTDAAARYGGEEIAVLLPNTDADGARVVVSQILDDIRVLNIIHDASPLNRVTLSAGVFADSSPADDLTPALMIQTADGALYQAKRNGKDRWELVEKS